VNSITLVKNALGKSAGSAVNDQCTCVAQYQATVSCSKDSDYYEEEVRGVIIIVVIGVIIIS
jgi:hypothetical protein